MTGERDLMAGAAPAIHEPGVSISFMIGLITVTNILAKEFKKNCWNRDLGWRGV
jgi:hypothetical protein